MEHRAIDKSKINGVMIGESLSNPTFGPKLKVPNASVNQTKLKIILQ